MSRNFVFYAAVLLLFGTGIYFILAYGSRLPVAAASPSAAPAHPGVGPEAAQAHAGGVAASLRENLQGPLTILLLQVIVIVIAARALGALFLKIHQPSVIGEMVAGILLGPSLLGLVAPGVQEFLFPASSMGALRLLSQI